MTIEELEEQTLKLKSIDKIHLVEKLLSSLDKPDAEIEAVWVMEADARLEAYERGELEVVPFDNVIKNLRNE